MGEVIALLGPLLWILVGLSIGWAGMVAFARGVATLNVIGVGVFIIFSLGIIMHFFVRKEAGMVSAHWTAQFMRRSRHNRPLTCD